MTVNGLVGGGIGTYVAGGPTVIIDGPAGETARVVLAKGIIQPVNNNFTGAYALQLDAQLAALAATDFPANNAAEFQTVDVLLTGSPIDISAMFDFVQVTNYVLAVDESQLPLGFVTSIIDPNNADLPLGEVSAPIYVQFNVAPVAVDDAVFTNENTVLAGDVLADNGNGSDSDSNPSDLLTIVAVNGIPGDVDQQVMLASGALLTLNADGTFSYDPNGAFDSLLNGQTDTDSFDYTLSDALLTDTATVTVTIQGVGSNNPPTFTSPADVSVPENSSPVITLAATDPELDTVVFSISGGADGALFQVSGLNNEELSFIATPDFELPADQGMNNVYDVEVDAFDGVNLVTLVMTVTVTDVNESPTVVLDPVLAIDENDMAGLSGTIALYGSLTTIDLSVNWGDPLSPPDLQSFTLSTVPLTKAADGIDWDPNTLTFQIDKRYLDDNPSGDASNVYTITVDVTDVGETSSANSTVTVSNVAPITEVGADVSIGEGTAVPFVGAFTDVGSLDSHTIHMGLRRQ